MSGRFPSRDEFIAELNVIADVAKSVPGIPAGLMEEFMDTEVAKHVALYDVVMRGLEAMVADEAEAILDDSGEAR